MARTIATGPMPISAGIAASRGRPTIRRSSRCATGRSAISSPRCCCRWACRCCSPATRSAAPSAATTTPIARTTKSPGSIGSNPAGGRGAGRFVRYLVHLRRRHRVFSRPRFFRGEVVSEAGVKDITWVTPSGRRRRRRLEQSGSAVARVCPERRRRRVLHTGRSARHRRELSRDDECRWRGLDFRFPILAANVVGGAGRYRRADRACPRGETLRAGRSLSAAGSLLRAVHRPGTAADATRRVNLRPAHYCSTASVSSSGGLTVAVREKKSFG